jgi:O-acetyl-ADP-ribose deacetylase (regulator of RNase III)
MWRQSKYAILGEILSASWYNACVDAFSTKISGSPQIEVSRLRIIQGDLFQQNVGAIVNTVNCKGVMGNGLAAIFKKRHPAMFEDYRRICLAGNLRPGVLHTWEVAPNRWIVNLPTKDAFWDSNRQSVPSRLEYVDSGLVALEAFAKERALKSIAVPALGWGEGGLELRDVCGLLEASAGRMPHTSLTLVLIGRS